MAGATSAGVTTAGVGVAVTGGVSVATGANATVWLAACGAAA